jgi:hypothetical protein
VLESGGREDSTPLVLKARLALNVFETYENVLAIACHNPLIEIRYRNIQIRVGWHLDSNWEFLTVAEEMNSAYAEMTNSLKLTP